MEVLRKYGAAATILFPLVDRGTLDLESTPVTFAAGDVQISKDEGAFANTTNLPTHEGNGIYSLALTATEMQHARGMLTLVDQTATKLWEDQAVLISTYGNASAQHAFDLDTASTAQTGDSFARLGAPAGASVSADIAAVEAQTDDIGVAGAGLTGIPWNSAWDAEVQSEVTDGLNAYDPPTKAEMDTGLAALNDITVADILAGNVEGTHTVAEVLRVMASALAGKASGLDTTTAVFRDLDDTKDRITATVDANGNRTAVTLIES